jgi:hypothetical protein
MKNSGFALLFILLSGLSHAQLLKPTGSLNIPRAGHSSHLLPNGKVLVIGGYNGVSSSAVTLASCKLYDPVTGIWTMAASMNAARARHGSILLGNGKVLVAGGMVVYPTYTRASCEIYDAASNTWQFTDSLDYSGEPDLVELPNGNILAIGGAYQDTCMIYDYVTNTWSLTGKLNHRQQYLHAVMLGTGDVLVVGSDTLAGEVYDLSSKTWHYTATKMSSYKYHSSLIWLSNSKILIATGNTTELFDPGMEIFSPGPALLSGVSNAPMARLGNQDIFMIGTGVSGTFNNIYQVYNVAFTSLTKAGMPDSSILTGLGGYTISRLNNSKTLFIGGFEGNVISGKAFLLDEQMIGINENIPAGSFSLFPNPATEEFVLQGDIKITGTAEIKIFNSAGQLVYSDIIKAAEINKVISVRDFESGIYHIQLTSGNTPYHSRLMIR